VLLMSKHNTSDSYILIVSFKKGLMIRNYGYACLEVIEEMAEIVVVSIKARVDTCLGGLVFLWSLFGSIWVDLDMLSGLLSKLLPILVLFPLSPSIVASHVVFHINHHAVMSHMSLSVTEVLA